MERLYNNIVLPDIWPPRNQETTLDKPLAVPYLQNKPDVIDISVGRQLFVDDFLIAQTDLQREEGKPETQPQPLLQPATELELNDGYCTCACPFNGGVFYDPESRTYKMWYQAGWFDGSAYAESTDGLHWQRLHELAGSTGDDRVLPRRPGRMRDGDAVWMDLDTRDPGQRYKMLVFYRCFDQDYRYYPFKPKHAHDDPTSIPPKEVTELYASADGIHWQYRGETSHSGDNTTFFYNPFRKKWVYSMRTFSALDSRIRVRSYHETDDLFQGRNWRAEDPVFWSRTDIFDKPDPDLGYYTQLYNLDAVAYESVMLGMYSVFMGPPNSVAGKTGLPKLNDLKLGFSRDGFHFSRGSYGDFLASSRRKGSWDYGYLHPANGICTVNGDKLYFYYSAFSGASPRFGSHKYSGGAVGVATLRRDGFCAMTAGAAGGTLTTEKLQHHGSRFFVNADCSRGVLWAELLDAQGNVLPGYSREACSCLRGMDSTRVELRWRGQEEGSAWPEVLRVRFGLQEAKLYAFWITDSAEGRSHGYLAAGSPESNSQGKDE